MTTMDGSSRSQSETHLKTQDEITAEDIADIKDWFNDEFIPVLRNLGYDIPEGYYCDLISSKDISPLDKIKIDQVLLTAGYKLDKDYIQETYNVVLDKDNPVGEPSNPALSFFDSVPQFI
jgi:Ca2+-binding EF-hand superfamily protein